MGTASFSRYLREVRDGDLSLPTAWIKRCGMDIEEPLGKEFEFTSTVPFDEQTPDTLVESLLMAARSPFATHCMLHAPYDEDDDFEEITAFIYEQLCSMNFVPTEVSFGYHAETDLPIIVISLFTEREYESLTPFLEEQCAGDL